MPAELRREPDDSVLLRTAAACARERIVLSYSRLELVSGRSRVPSFYAFEALQAAGQAAFNIDAAARTSETRIGWPAPEKPQHALDDAEYDLAFWKTDGNAAWLKDAAPHLHRSLRTRWARWDTKWRSLDGMVDLDVEALQVLAKFRLREHAHSATALQQYARCPYRFALRTVYGLRSADSPSYLHRMDPVTRGVLFHQTQAELFHGAGETLDEILDRVAFELASKLAPSLPAVWQSEVEVVRIDLQGWLRQKSLDPEWAPVHSEFTFESTILDGIRVKGSIDLIEKHATGMLRVTDHKTGSVVKPLPEHVGAGEVLQPVLYALVAQASRARLYYATLRQNYRAIEINVDPMASQRLAQVLQTIDDSLYQGWLPAAPRKEGCKHCEYLPVCGPYEEERIGVKSQVELRELKKLRSLK
ncbi:MAG: PD-(D/E)XK nuclease family protein [Bryobacteraceae bacterium]